MEKIFLLSNLLAISLLLLLPSQSSAASQGFRVNLARIDSHGNFTKSEHILRATLRSHHRMARMTGTDMSKVISGISAGNPNIQSPVHAGEGDFLMDLAIGTPSKSFTAILDTGSDLIWTQCKPCTQCFSQPTPIFDPSKSSTFSKQSCSASLCRALPSSACNSDSSCKYRYAYGDSSSTQGVLGFETFTFGSDAISHVGFGCGYTNQGGFSPASGLVGLGRGPLSLVSQLPVSKFSYCLTSVGDTSKKSALLFGSLAQLKGSNFVTTPLIKNDVEDTFYYLNLKGITVGNTLLKYPSTAFALGADGSGGLIIDSGTTITYLENSAYNVLKKAFLSQVQLQVADGSAVGLDLCFKMPRGSSNVQVPRLVFHFQGADLELPAENYMLLDSDSGLLCLAVMGSSGFSIFGNIQQQNMQVLYDLGKESLSFLPVQCDQV